jgi:hypothetical protein
VLLPLFAASLGDSRHPVDRSNRSGQVVQDIRKKPIMKVHVNGFANIGIARSMQGQRHSGLIKMRVETGRPLEGPYVELIWKFESDFGLVWDWFGHHTSGKPRDQ